LCLFVLVREPWVLALVLGVFGVATGLATTAAYTRGGRDIPAAAHGMGYGLLNAAALAGLAVGPVVAGLLAKASLLWVFGIDMAMLALLPLVLGVRPSRPTRP
jgi:MFS family permease